MEHILEKTAVKRVATAVSQHGCSGSIRVLEDSARTAAEAAAALGITVGQIASSLIFTTPSGQVILVITSGRHRVETDLVAQAAGVTHLERVDAAFVKEFSGFSIGGVSPLGWINTPDFLFIDIALNDYDVIWAAAGHPHAVFPTTFAELATITSATTLTVAHD